MNKYYMHTDTFFPQPVSDWWKILLGKTQNHFHSSPKPLLGYMKTEEEINAVADLFRSCGQHKDAQTKREPSM